MKLRRTIAKVSVGSYHATSNGKGKGFYPDATTALAAVCIPIPGPLALWLGNRGGVPLNHLCIGEVGAWHSTPVEYGRWNDLWPVFEAYARFL